VRLSSRRSDDADVIRARLRLLLDERTRPPGWVPGEPDDDDPADDPLAGDAVTAPVAAEEAAPDPAVQDGLGRHRAPGRETRWEPGRSGARSLWIAGLLAALLLAGWTWLDRPQVEPVDGSSPASSAPLPSPVGGSSPASSAPLPSPVGEVADASPTVVVSVVGQVAAPSLVTLPSGSRVADAIAAAGGLLPEADPASVNLAAVVADGEQLAVGMPGTAAPGGAPPGAPTGPGAGTKVDLNTAGVAELDALPGIGPVLAQRIVDHRTGQGLFRSVDELDDVPGIGPAIAAALAELVTV
jgi:competence protein ComEA